MYFKLLKNDKSSSMKGSNPLECVADLMFSFKFWMEKPLGSLKSFSRGCIIQDLGRSNLEGGSGNLGW